MPNKTLTKHNFNESDPLRQVWLVRFDDGRRISHVGLFLDPTPGEEDGVLFHLAFDSIPKSKTVISKSCTMMCFARPRKPTFINDRQYWEEKRVKREKIMDPIPGARSNELYLLSATDRVFKDFKYELFHENCQTFAIETLRYLNRWDPCSVSPKAIQFVKDKSFIGSRIATNHREKRGQLSESACPDIEIPHPQSSRPMVLPLTDYPPANSRRKSGAADTQWSTLDASNGIEVSNGQFKIVVPPNFKMKISGSDQSSGPTTLSIEPVSSTDPIPASTRVSRHCATDPVDGRHIREVRRTGSEAEEETLSRYRRNHKMNATDTVDGRHGDKRGQYFKMPGAWPEDSE